jgi:hypothetical protein
LGGVGLAGTGGAGYTAGGGGGGSGGSGANKAGGAGGVGTQRSGGAGTQDSGETSVGGAGGGAVGAGVAGTNVFGPGTGGAGFTSDITGTSVVYGAGGAAYGQIGTTPGKGSTSNGYSRDANNVLAVGNGVNGAVIIRHAVANANRTNGATLKVQSGAGVVSIGGNIANLSNLLLDSSSAINLTGAISGTGALSKLNANTLTLTGLATYTGSTEVTAGGVVLTNNVAPATSGFTGAGTVVIEPSTSFTSAVTSAYNFASTLTGLRLGKENNTQSLTISSAIGIAGPVSLYGAGITINHNIDTRAGGVSGDVLLKSSGDINHDQWG